MKPFVDDSKESRFDSMFRRRHLVIAFMVAVFSLVAIDWFRSKPSPRLQHENLPQIRVGMAQVEVESLLGGPPGDYGHNQGGISVMTAEGMILPPGSIERIWHDDVYQFEIGFDADGRVISLHKRAGFARGAPMGFFDQLRQFVQQSFGQ